MSTGNCFDNQLRKEQSAEAVQESSTCLHGCKFKILKNMKTVIKTVFPT